MAKQMICTGCGSLGDAKSVTRGSIIIELFLWLCFLLPGLLYSLWRLTTRHKACRQCGSAQLVPTATPAGKELLQRYHKAAA
jgi:hypothetical protein